MTREQISLGGVPIVGFGEDVTKPTDLTLRAGVGGTATALFWGGIGTGIGYALSKPSNRIRYQKNGAIAGAAVAGVVGCAVLPVIFCGLFSSKSEQEEIDRKLLPNRILWTVGGVSAALAGGTLGAAASKSHPVVGTLAGASMACGIATAVANTTTKCPETGST